MLRFSFTVHSLQKKHNMRACKLTPMMWAENLSESIHFYTNILGFTFGEKNEE